MGCSMTHTATWSLRLHRKWSLEKLGSQLAIMEAIRYFSTDLTMDYGNFTYRHIIYIYIWRYSSRYYWL